jgi:hypothetical protein
MVVTTITGKNPENSQGNTQIEQARKIGKSLGYYTAGRYLAIRGWSIEAALFELLGK